MRTFLWNWSPNGLLEEQKLWKIRFSCWSSQVKMEECDRNVWNVFNQFDVGKSGLTTYFLEVGARVSLKLATKGIPRGKKTLKFSFGGCFSKGNTKECYQKFWNVFEKFFVITRSWNKNFLEVGARVSLKLATKVFPRGKRIVKIDFLRLIF